MGSGRMLKFALCEVLQFAGLCVPLFIVMQRFAVIVAKVKTSAQPPGDASTAYWLIVASAVAYVTSTALLVWVPLKYMVFVKKKFLIGRKKWRPVALVYVVLSTLPCFAFLIASSEVQINNNMKYDMFTELPVSLVLFSLICIDVVERIRHCRLTGQANDMERDADIPSTVLTHVEQVTPVIPINPAVSGPAVPGQGVSTPMQPGASQLSDRNQNGAGTRPETNGTVPGIPDSGSFLIFNDNHNKCIKVESATSVTLAPCDPHAKQQQFRWASQSRVLSLSLKLCLGATEIKDWVKVLLFECDDNSDLQHWQCKNETLFGLKDQDLHLNWGNRNERNIMIYKGSGTWSHWRIFGTRGDLCSKGYQEIFTIGGNAFGAPCQLPFKFGENWYAECTKEGRVDGQLWCATERDYDIVRKWGFCPTQASSGWDTDPVTEVQYQRNAQSVLTWHQARKSCQQQGADLLSIVELHEQSYISGLTNALGTSLWIGLNSLDFESGWQWSNGNPFRYLNWAPGKDQPSYCPSHWVPYASNCYYLERNTKMWRDALVACHKEGGDLASILNIEEQSFIISQSGYYRKQGCVALTTGAFAGLWDVVSCSNKEKYICKKPAEGVLRTTVPPTTPDLSCASGWTPADKRNVCYKLYKKQKDLKKTWHEAQDFCKAIGGDLMSIHSSQDLSNAPFHASDGAWIGFSSLDTNQGFVWTDGSANDFENWGYGEPNNYNDNEHCAEVQFYYGRHWNDRHCEACNDWICQIRKGVTPKPEPAIVATGYWNDINCGMELPSICKRSSSFINTTMAPTTVPKGGCAPEWLSFQGKCYKFVVGNDNKNWQEARTYCINQGGNLVSIVNDREQAFLTTQMLRYNADFWIGMNDVNWEMHFVWTDGKGLSYTNWAKGHPTSVPDGRYSFMDEMFDCVIMVGSVSKVTGFWKVEDCNAKHGLICKRNIDTAPTEPPQLPGSCPEPKKRKTWIPFRGHCYSFLSSVVENWAHASVECLKMGGSLVSIQDPQEGLFIQQNLELLQDGAKTFWIGLFKTHEGEWMWIDNSVVDYTNWKTGMPKSESCVDINSDSGQWSTNSCSRYRSYICKTAKVITPTEKPPSVAHIIKEASHGSAGITLAIVLVVIATVGLGAFLLFRKRIPTPVLGECNFDNKLYFNNPIRALVDTKSLVANIEQNEQA
ncbi:hypothetical protein F2P81_019080 [Scophthalmus maximus]|uniref:Macrophage mannose receptor 1 n=1 Tax=Scophthalmus maximus TaxID=52904 RepID=A0A6A4S0T9_SCOMX|nr:hypothetical protein F2P81_019080 [Scophthalmus maximus]